MGPSSFEVEGTTLPPPQSANGLEARPNTSRLALQSRVIPMQVTHNYIYSNVFVTYVPEKSRFGNVTQ